MAQDDTQSSQDQASAAEGQGEPMSRAEQDRLRTLEQQQAAFQGQWSRLDPEAQQFVRDYYDQNASNPRDLWQNQHPLRRSEVVDEFGNFKSSVENTFSAGFAEQLIKGSNEAGVALFDKWHEGDQEAVLRLAEHARREDMSEAELSALAQDPQAMEAALAQSEDIELTDEKKMELTGAGHMTEYMAMFTQLKEQIVGKFEDFDISTITGHLENIFGPLVDEVKNLVSDSNVGQLFAGNGAVMDAADNITGADSDAPRTSSDGEEMTVAQRAEARQEAARPDREQGPRQPGPDRPSGPDGPDGLG